MSYHIFPLSSHFASDRQEELDQVFKTYNDDCWNTLLRTLAGGAVAGYLLGVADRHYENMRLAQDPTTGKACRFHHIDFGFLFGKRPLVDASLLALPVKYFPFDSHS